MTVDVMGLPVAREHVDVCSESEAARLAAFVDWVNEMVNGEVAGDAVLSLVIGEAHRRGIDCSPRMARQRKLDGRGEEYWAVVVDPGLPVHPMRWEGDDG